MSRSRIAVVILPSGRRASVRYDFDPTRPWELDGAQEVYRLRRPKRGDSTAWQVYIGNNIRGDEFTEEDALALAAHLNRPRIRHVDPPEAFAPPTDEDAVR